MTTTDVSHIIPHWQSGNKTAENQLYQHAYLQLHKLAQKERKRNAIKHGENNGVLIDSVNCTTALIHDAYIKLSNSTVSDIKSQRDFLLMMTKIMQQILIDNARALQAQKRQVPTALNDEHDPFEQFIIMDKALDNFSQRYPRQSYALKLKYLLGMKNQEIGELLECSASLIEKDLKFSRCWLQSRMA